MREFSNEEIIELKKKFNNEIKNGIIYISSLPEIDKYKFMNDYNDLDKTNYCIDKLIEIINNYEETYNFYIKKNESRSFLIETICNLEQNPYFYKKHYILKPFYIEENIIYGDMEYIRYIAKQFNINWIEHNTTITAKDRIKLSRQLKEYGYII
jgi:hypothetical protein